MEQHCGNISNALSTCADLKQTGQVPLTLREKCSLSMFISNAIDEKNRIYQCALLTFPALVRVERSPTDLRFCGARS